MSKLVSTGLNAGKQRGPTIVGGKGVYLQTKDGREILDFSNTGGPLGHSHPHMVETVQQAAAIAPALNEGWHWEGREVAAQKLIETAFSGEEDWVGGVRFFLSGSEANDAALSFSQAFTERKVLATRERAYHGMTGLSRDMTIQPHWHGGLSVEGGKTQPVPPSVEVRSLPAPEGARYLADGLEKPSRPNLAHCGDALSDVAAVILDYTQGGRYYDPVYQEQMAAHAKSAGALWIADEVITGLGRSGRWFAFQGAESRPDIVTLGKPIAGGSSPGGAVVFSKRIVDLLKDKSWQTYSTYRGHPLMVAAIRGYLEVMARDRLMDRVEGLSAHLCDRLLELGPRHPSIKRIDGYGLHWTVELHGPDWREWTASTAETPIASKVAAHALGNGVLLATSGEQTSIFLAPPLIITKSQIDTAIDVLDDALSLADQEFAETSKAS